MGIKQIKLLQQVADAQSGSFAIKDSNNCYVSVNQLFADQVGLEIAQLIGRTDSELGISDLTATLTDSVQSITTQATVADGSAGNAPMATRAPDELADGHSTTGTALSVAAPASLNDAPSNQDESRQFSVLNDLMGQMMAFERLDPLLQHIAEVMIDLTVASDALILLVDENNEFMKVVACAGSNNAENLGIIRECGVGFAGLAWSTGDPQYISDSDSNSLTKGFWPANSQLIAVPLKNEDRVIGVAVLGADGAGKGFNAAAGFVNSLAGLAGIAISSAQSLERSRAEIRRMSALSDVSKLLAQFTGIDDILSRVSKTMLEAMNIDNTSSYLVSEAGTLVPCDSWQLVRGVVAKAEGIPSEVVNETICQWCYIYNEVVHIPRNKDDSRESTRIHELRRDRRIGSTLCLPVANGNKVVGLLVASRELGKRNFDDTEIHLFRNVVNQLSNAIYGHEMSRALQHQVYHDGLTQLPNRRHFESELQRRIDQQCQNKTMAAVIFLDLDGFKGINDSMGRRNGDELLKHVSTRLENRTNGSDLLARIGGDEFAVIASNLKDRDQALEIAERLASSLSEPFKLAGGNVKIRTSVGLSVFPTDGRTADELLRNADEAIHNAKANGKNRVICYQHKMGNDARERTKLEAELREAIDKQQFVLYYQPQVNAETGLVIGVEALIRWQHPERGFVSPGVFIPLAEETGMINHIGAWVLKQSIKQLGEWRDTALSHIRIGINIAAPQFLLEAFTDDVLQLLQESQVSPSMLELEVTESIVMNDVESVINRLDILRAAGIRVAVDDFGTGYSSLSYLQDLPLDVLKIDRAFVTRLDDEHGEHSLVNTIQLLADGLKLGTIAEGVETLHQLEQVMRLGCNMIQGFYFSKPTSVEDLPAVIQSIEEDFARVRLRKAS